MLHDHDTLLPDTTSSPLEPEPPRFFDEPNFNRLRQLQQELYKTTETSISLRKLVNLLITQENLNHLKETLLKQLSNINYP